MTDYGIRVSKDGVDVKTGDDRDMVITSKYPVLKGKLQGNGTETVASSVTKVVTITHSLGYIPFGQIFVKNPFSTDWFQGPLFAGGATGSIEITYHTTSTTLVINFKNDTTVSQTFDYQYFIFLDKGKL